MGWLRSNLSGALTMSTHGGNGEQLLYEAALDSCGIGAVRHAGQPTPVA
jgi:hypothetical protein